MYKQFVSLVSKDMANIIIWEFLHPQKTKQEVKLTLLSVLSEIRMKHVLQEIKQRRRDF